MPAQTTICLSLISDIQAVWMGRPRTAHLSFGQYKWAPCTVQSNVLAFHPPPPYLPLPVAVVKAFVTNTKLSVFRPIHSFIYLIVPFMKIVVDCEIYLHVCCTLLNSTSAGFIFVTPALPLGYFG